MSVDPLTPLRGLNYLLRLSWGFTSLHPRLYAFTRFAGFDFRNDTDFSRQTFPLAQEPFSAQQTDDKKKIYRHVPQVLGHAFRVRRLAVSQIVHQRLQVVELVVLAASFRGDPLQQLGVLRRAVILTIQIAD